MTPQTLRVLVLIATCLAGIGHLGADRPWVLGLEELHRIDQLPALKRSVRVASISSYDRTGGNDDGFSGKYSSVRKEGNGLVIADLEGPGIIYRIWTPTPTNDMVEFHFDGETAPRIRIGFRELFMGKAPPFVSPLVGYGGGGFYCYVPLPFKKSCKVVIRAEKVQFYQINYAVYPDEAPITTFDPQLSARYLADQGKAMTVLAARGDDLTRWNVPPGAATETHPFDVKLGAGQTATLLETDQPGRIAAIRLRPASSIVNKERDILLRITWDSDEQPAVLCPAGDFFGYAWGSPAVAGCLLGTANDVNYCYYPMPFDKSARIELISAREAGPPVELRGEIVSASVPRAADEGRFYAVWRRENPTTKGSPFTFVETRGRGHLVGCILQAQGMESGNTYFFEGDDQTTIDGELVIHGTGSEDFFNGGWYDVPGRWEKRLSFPLSGCLGYQKQLARTGGYRLMIADACSFRENLLQTIEHAPTENSLETDYCSVSFLYSEGRPTREFTMPTPAERRVIDFDKVTFAVWWSLPTYAFAFQNTTLTKSGIKLDGKDVRFLSLRATGPDFFGLPFIAITCELPTPGRWAVSVEAVKGPEQGIVQLFQNEAPVGPAADLYAESPAKSEPLDMGTLALDEGPNHLMFKITGKNEASKAEGFDLVNIICRKIE